MAGYDLSLSGPLGRKTSEWLFEIIRRFPFTVTRDDTWHTRDKPLGAYGG